MEKPYVVCHMLTSLSLFQAERQAKNAYHRGAYEKSGHGVFLKRSKATGRGQCVAAVSEKVKEWERMEDKILEISKNFWNAMEHADEAGMRKAADPDCNFVHIGITCKLDQEIEFYTSGAFQPTEIRFNGQTVNVFGDTAVVITDCNYGLLLEGKPTTHHFAVTEVYARQKEEWKLVTFSFTALVY